jgi:hypothetical protein
MWDAKNELTSGVVKKKKPEAAGRKVADWLSDDQELVLFFF